MKFTGERYLSDSNAAQISYEHWHRYFYAMQFVKGKDVLDIACGEGYGANLMAQTAKTVVGVDISQKTIDFAKKRYRRGNLSFLQGSVENIPIQGTKKFDIVISFETIEHVDTAAQEKFLSEVKRLLKDSGVFIGSSPNKLLYSDIPKYKNEFHVKEFYEREFVEFLRKYFKQVSLLGQKVFTGSDIWQLGASKRAGSFVEHQITNDGQRFVADDQEKEALYLVAVCSDVKVKPVEHSLLLDKSLSLLSEKGNELRRIILERDGQIGNLNQAVAERESQIISLGASVAEREGQIAGLNLAVAERNQEVQSLTEMLAQRDAVVSARDGRLQEINQTLTERDVAVAEREGQIANLGQAVAERDQKIQALTETVAQRDAVVTERDGQIARLNHAVAERNSAIDEQIAAFIAERTHIFNSTSWRITNPLRAIRRTVVNKPYRLMRKTISDVARQAWIKLPLSTHHKLLLKNGLFNSLPFVFRWSRAYRSWVDVNATSDAMSDLSNERYVSLSDTSGSEIKTDEMIFHSSTSILFVGHDALLAGAQVLLLSLVKWFSQHTGIEFKIILLRGGVLLDKFKKIAPVLIWEDFINAYPDEEKRKEILHEFVGKVDLIYGNTVVAPSIYNDLKFLKVPYITHVHELEKSIKMYVDKNTIEKMHLYTDGYIAGSKPVELNLITNHNIDQQAIITINDFIEKRETNFAISKKDLRKNLGLIEEGLIVFGCGTMYWRKGVDLFIETALMLKQKGYSSFHFYWIGENIWDLDHASHRMFSWNELEQKIIKNGLKNHITFLGVKENFFDYFLAGDIFYLTSREDPFPLVCLEAAQCSIPVICFEDAGGMPDFVEDDAGFVVPFEDVNEVAEKIIYLDNNHDILKELGATARKKILLCHSIDIAAPEILSFCQKIGNLQPAVSIIVPNYNCEKYLGKRLDSILNQTFKDYEIIILDDASSDHSIEIIEKYQRLPFVKLFKSQTNSGNPFRQWHKGFLQAKGEILWFAEADDFCEPDFLQKLLQRFNDASVALAYCDSFKVDESDKVVGDYGPYVFNLDAHHWKSSYQVTGTQEINFGLGVKNSIPNASAVLIRKSCISEAIFNETFQFKFSGDWFFYTQVIKGKDLAFCSEKLNYHRKHSQTVSSKFNTDKSAIQLLLKETELVHSNILENYSVDVDYLKKWEFYIAEQMLAFYPNTVKKELNRYYPYTLIEEKIKKAIIKNENSKRLVFLTTNDGASNGGSEQLWIETAIECRKRGHDVMVIIKKWVPEPSFIQVFHDVGIKVLFKGHDDFKQALMFKPDLLVVSTGDQDEGIEWYDKCRKHKVSYVIINQLTKEPEYWPIRRDINEQVKNGYLGAVMVFFTCNNNHKVMEKRLNCQIPNASIHYNPFHVDRNSFVPFPPMDDGLKIAIPANLLRVHKGQHLAIELFSQKKWRERPIQLNLYGEGSDEKILKAMAKKDGLKKVLFHKHTHDLLTIWWNNHAIFMPSFMEGLPLILVGAMICARVPILTDIGAHRELIDDNINGFIATKPTVEALDEALERAYQKSAMWEEIGQKAREKILAYLPPNDPVDDFISKIIPLTNKKQDYSFGCKLPVDEWAYLNRIAIFNDPDLRKYVSPFPSIKLMQNTTGLTKDSAFASHGADFWIALSQASPKPLNEFTSILDFGCGCGRLARMFKGYSGHLAGCDIDHRHIEWCSATLGYMIAKLSSVRPPIPFTDNEFEAVISISIFTHLNESSQDQFLQELRRVCRPDGLLFLTIHGGRALDRAIAEPSIKTMLCVREDLFQAARKDFANGRHSFILQQGHLTTVDDNNNEVRTEKVISVPFEYGITFIPENYLRSHWVQWFDIVDYRVGAIHDFQDIVVLKPKKIK